MRRPASRTASCAFSPDLRAQTRRLRVRRPLPHTRLGRARPVLQPRQQRRHLHRPRPPTPLPNQIPSAPGGSSTPQSRCAPPRRSQAWQMHKWASTRGRWLSPRDRAAPSVMKRFDRGGHAGCCQVRRRGRRDPCSVRAPGGPKSSPAGTRIRTDLLVTAPMRELRRRRRRRMWSPTRSLPRGNRRGPRGLGAAPSRGELPSSRERVRRVTSRVG
jgi:hypothetical protein